MSSLRNSTLSIGSFHEGGIEHKSNIIPISDLSQIVQNAKESGELKQQFLAITRGQVMKWDFAKQVTSKRN